MGGLDGQMDGRTKMMLDGVGATVSGREDKLGLCSPRPCAASDNARRLARPYLSCTSWFALVTAWRVLEVPNLCNSLHFLPSPFLFLPPSHPHRSPPLRFFSSRDPVLVLSYLA